MNENIEFIRYYRNQHVHFDEIYFIRKSSQNPILNLSVLSHLDVDFSTSHDLLVANILAYQLINDYLEKSELKNSNLSFPSTLQWKESKTALVELIYALEASKAIDAEIKEIADTLGQAFNIDLSDIYRNFIAVKNRKIDSTKFIDKLKVSLENKFDY